MAARLVSFKDDKPDMAFALHEGGTMIGRDGDNLIQLPDPEVSKHHAVVRFENGEWCIEDAGSKNGLQVNGSKVQRAVLADGDRIVIEPYILVFESHVSGHDWTPGHVIDLSDDSAGPTVVRRKHPGQ